MAWMCRIVKMIQVFVAHVRSLFLIAAVLLWPAISVAHSPHHVITDVAVSTGNATGNHTFILISDQVFRSGEEGGSWKNLVNGLNNQYAFTSVVISPEYASDKTLFVASGGDGVYRSIDSGNSWQKVNSGIGASDIAKLSISIKFGNDRRLLAASNSGGAWRSIDGGDSWSMVLTEAVQLVDFAEIVSTEDQAIVFAGDTAGNIWRSDDNGRLWEIANEQLNAGAITSISGTAEHLYVGTEKHGLYHSTDGGQTFVFVKQLFSLKNTGCRDNQLPQSEADRYISSVNVSTDVSGESRVLVTTWYGALYVSRDNAQSWSVWDSGLRCDSQADQLRVPHFRSVATADAENGNTIFWLASFDGLFRGVGEGSHWQQLETLPLGLIKGMAVPRGTRQRSAVAISTYGGGFYLTEDRGSSWTIGNKGLQTTRLTGLAFSRDYDADGVIYAGAIRRLLKSSDRGQSWQRINLQKVGLGDRIRNKLNSWGVPTGWFGSSGRKSSAPVFPTHIATLAGTRAGQVLIATRRHGVIAFDESSGSIESVWSGTDQIINSLVVSPNFAQDNTLFSSIRGQGVFRSADDGDTWVSANGGLPFVNSWADNPGGGDFRRDVFVAISPEFDTDDMLFAGSPAGDGLYVSRNRGDSWKRVVPESARLPAPVLAVAVSPDFRMDNTVIISIKGQGIFRSMERKLQLEAIGDPLMIANVSIELLAFSPNYANDHSIFAASDEQLFVSEDKGESWKEIPRPVRYEDMRDVVTFDGDWEQQGGEQYSAMTETVTSIPGSKSHLRFVGAGIRWIGSRSPRHGTAQVYVDGKLLATVSCRSGGLENMQQLFVKKGLEFGQHTIEVRVIQGSDEGPSGIVGIDAFDVLPRARTSP
jgi:photosystem II stability/assembly factor-like uncharacterized protein